MPRSTSHTSPRSTGSGGIGSLGGVVVGGVDPDDTADPAATRAALEAASFVVSLEQRETDVTRLADVVLPTAQWAEEEGTMTNLEGRVIRRRRALPTSRAGSSSTSTTTIVSTANSPACAARGSTSAGR